jgi:ribonuclease P protein component
MVQRGNSTNVSAQGSSADSPNGAAARGRQHRQYTLGRSKRLKRRRDFEHLIATRCSAADTHLIVYVARNELDACRLGVSVARRMGGSVKRNRIKRLIREAFRLSQYDLPPKLDVLCIARPVEHPRLDTYRKSLPRLVHLANDKLQRKTKRGN